MNKDPYAEIEEQDLCADCTRNTCTDCPNQSETDRMLGIDALADIADNNNEAEIEQPSHAKDKDDDEFEEDCLLPLDPRHVIPPQPKKVEVAPREKHHATSQSSTTPPKRRPGAPKGNLNALKHGIYISGSSVKNTTPMERARLGDLHNLIDHVKTYIEKVYQNGLTLKTTEEMNDTLKKISSATIALTRLLHTQDALMDSGIPYSLSGDTRAKQIKILSYYQKRQDLYLELTDPNYHSPQEPSVDPESVI